MILISGVTISTSVSAQNALTQVARSNDGNLSVRLPTEWAFVDTTSPFYSTLLIFGDSAAAIQSMVTIDLQSKPSTLAGRAGVVGIWSPANYPGISAEQETGLLTQSLIQASQLTNTQILDQQNATFADGHSGTLISYANATDGSKGIAAVFLMNGQIIVANLASSAQTFDTNRDLLMAIQQTARAPAERAAPTLPTGTASGQSTPLTAAPGTGIVGLPGIAAPPGQTIRVNNGSFSIVLPTGWVTTDVTTDQQVFVYGNSSAGRDTRVLALQSNQPTTAQIQDNGGLVILFAPADFKAISPVDPVALLNSQLQQPNIKIIEAVQSFQVKTNLGAYAVIDTGNQRGFVALIVFGNKIAYLTATSAPGGFDANRASLFTILQSVRVPAETSGGLPGLTGKTAP